MRFRVNEDSTTVSGNTNKQPTFSTENGDSISGRPDKHESIRKTVATDSSQVETEEVTDSWIRTKSVTVEEKALVVQEGMVRALGSH
jgi:hypothetical protein